MRLSGRGVVVTGSTGIAAAGARRLAGEGASVFVMSLTEESCSSLVEDIRASGGRADGGAVDLTDEAATERLFVEARRRLDRIDGLLAVAGGSGRPFGDGPLHDVPLEGWEATWHLNGDTAFLAMREALRAMLDEPSPGGSIVVVTSVLADHPAPDMFATHAYAAVKGAEVALVRAAAAYYAPRGVRINALAPGLVATPMSARAAANPTTVDYARAKQPLAGAFLPPEAVADAALFLLSDEARFVTGQVLAVDGGWGVTEARPR